MTIENFKKAIKEGNFKLAKDNFDLNNVEQLEGVLVELAFDDNEDISSYFFILSLILEKETAELHNIASDLVSGPYCWMPGGYAVGLQHMRKAISLEPGDVSYKQAILLFHNIPERLLSKEEAIKYAQQVLEEDPSSKVAQELLKKYNMI